jgi:hypothetical protein
MTELLPLIDLDAFVSTRFGLHCVAEHVIAKARYVDDGEIRLTAFPGGFATPLLSGRRRVRVDGADIVIDDDDGARRDPLTTVGQAAGFVGVEPGFPNEVYAPATPFLPDAPLNIDVTSAESLAAWYGFTATVLDDFAREIADGNPSQLILWPEHFDQAFYTEDEDELRRANYGASPGDDAHPEPYLYVGPWQTPVADRFWNASSFDGAVLSIADLAASTDPAESALQFLRDGRSVLAVT